MKISRAALVAGYSISKRFLADITKLLASLKHFRHHRTVLGTFDSLLRYALRAAVLSSALDKHLSKPYSATWRSDSFSALCASKALRDFYRWPFLAYRKSDRNRSIAIEECATTVSIPSCFIESPNQRVLNRMTCNLFQPAHLRRSKEPPLGYPLPLRQGAPKGHRSQAAPMPPASHGEQS